MLGQDINTLTSCIEIKRLFWGCMCVYVCGFIQHDFFFLFLKFILFVFIFGCVGSSLLHVGFL